MTSIVKFAKTIRNNWKKSVFFSLAAAYGYNYGQKKFSESLLRRAYCREAEAYGNQPLTIGQLNRKITVFLNPAASGGRAKVLFEKHAAPILHMAGISVTVVKTEYEGQAKEYMKVIENIDGVIVAGGDATILDVVTGLLRTTKENEKCKLALGIIPLGKSNHISQKLFGDSHDDVKAVCDSAMAIVKGITKDMDVLYIKGDEEGKNAYALSGIEWGAYRHTINNSDKHWYFGPLKKYMSYVMASFKGAPEPVEGHLMTSEPCTGCSKCFVKPKVVKTKWWKSMLYPQKQIVPTVDYSNVENPNCGIWSEQDVNTTQLIASTINGHQQKTESSVILKIFKHYQTRKEFVQEGWRQIKDKSDNEDIETNIVGDFKFNPQLKQGQENWFTIDNELYEAMPIQVKLLKNKLPVYSL